MMCNINVFVQLFVEKNIFKKFLINTLSQTLIFLFQFLFITMHAFAI